MEDLALMEQNCSVRANLLSSAVIFYNGTNHIVKIKGPKGKDKSLFFPLLSIRRALILYFTTIY